MIRVLHVLGSLNVGGAETRIMEIYRHINRNEIQFDFAIHTNEECVYSKEALDLGSRIFVLPKFKGINYFNYFSKWNEILRNNDISVVHGHMTSTAFVYLRLAKKYGINKRFAHARNSKKSNIIKYFLAKMARFYASDLLAVSKKAAISEFGIKYHLGKVKIISNSVDLEKYAFDQVQRQHFRTEMNIENDTLIIGQVGRLYKSKNYFFTLKLMRDLDEKKQKFAFFIIGEGELRKKIESRIEKYKIQEKVHLLGYQKNMQKVYSGIDLLVMPSKYEGLPGTIIEAQYSGLPVIMSKNITPEVVIGNKDKVSRLSLKRKRWIKQIKNVNLYRRCPKQYNNNYEMFEVSNIIKIYEDLYKTLR